MGFLKLIIYLFYWILWYILIYFIVKVNICVIQQADVADKIYFK